jgi:ribosomal protein S4
MAIQLRKRREHRKLNKIRLVIWQFLLKGKGSRHLQPIFGVSHHRRLLKQRKLSWFCAKWVRMLFARFSIIPNNSYLLRSGQISTVIKTYFIKHQSVQEFKAFYGQILSRTFKVFVKGCSTFYNKLFFFKHLNLVDTFKKVLSFRSSLVSVLESRLATVVWRRFFRSSINRAHKLIVFGKIKVNKKFITKASFLLNSGRQIFVVKHCWFSFQFLKNSGVWHLLPFRIPSPHLEVSFSLYIIFFLYKPYDTELGFPFFPKLHFVRSFYL